MDEKYRPPAGAEKSRPLTDIEKLQQRHPFWDVRRLAYGAIECKVNGYTLVAHGVAAAGRGMTEWEKQTGVTAPEGASSARAGG